MIVISKPNKKSYNLPKVFRPVVLLNTVSKLIEKVIRERLQFNTASNEFIHPSQLSGLKLKSTVDVGIALIYIIYTGWVKNLSTSTLAFDIAQFFPLLNHCLLFLIIRKAGFDNHIVSFFTSYLIDRKTNLCLLYSMSMLEQVRALCSLLFYLCYIFHLLSIFQKTALKI